MLGVLLAWPKPAQACVCGMVSPSDTAAVRSDFLETISEADKAFAGRVYSLDNLRVTFRVVDAWKGDFGASVTLPTGREFHDNGTVSEDTCDPEFELHRSYLIVLHRNPAGLLKASKCGVWAGVDMRARVQWLEKWRRDLPGITAAREQAIGHALRELERRGLESGSSHDAAIHLPVRFRDGEEGLFIAIGFSGAARGYSMIGRVVFGRFEPFEIRRDDVDWGVFSLRGERRTVNGGTMKMILDPRVGPEEVVMIQGAVHRGTDDDEEGHLELLRVNQRRIEVLFKGAAADGFVGASQARLWTEHSFDMIDTDRDGVDEICRNAIGLLS